MCCGPTGVEGWVDCVDSVGRTCNESLAATGVDAGGRAPETSDVTVSCLAGTGVMNEPAASFGNGERVLFDEDSIGDRTSSALVGITSLDVWVLDSFVDT